MGQMKDEIENEIILYISDLVPASAPHSKAFREFLFSPEGLKLLRTGRKYAFEYAEQSLKEAFPDLDIKSFPDDTPVWER